MGQSLRVIEQCHQADDNEIRGSFLPASAAKHVVCFSVDVCYCLFVITFANVRFFRFTEAKCHFGFDGCWFVACFTLDHVVWDSTCIATGLFPMLIAFCKIRDVLSYPKPLGSSFLKTLGSLEKPYTFLLNQVNVIINCKSTSEICSTTTPIRKTIFSDCFLPFYLGTSPY